MRSQLVAYLLWMPCCLLVCGLHRFYLGRPLSGLVYLLTFGLLGFGQLFDLLTIPQMVSEANRHGGVHVNVANTVVASATASHRRQR